MLAEVQVNRQVSRYGKKTTTARTRSRVDALRVCITSVLLSILCTSSVVAQSAPTPSPFSFMAVIDSYYAYDFNHNQEHELPFFMFNTKRSDEFNINLALLRGSYATPSVRANLGLMSGTYAQYNLYSEQELFRSIYEANAGVSFGDSSGVWFDVGILPSHLGFESVVMQDDWTITRSLSIEGSPFYLSGARLTAQLSDVWSVMGILCNGWQHIRRSSGNTSIWFGTQVQCKPSSKLTLNWSTLIGSDDADSIARERIYNDFYLLATISPRFQVAVGFDIGYQQHQSSTGSGYAMWNSPLLILRLQALKQLAFCLRTEYFNDPEGVIFSVAPNSGLILGGNSLTAEYTPNPQITIRAEERWFESEEKIFRIGSLPVATQSMFLFALSVRVP